MPDECKNEFRDYQIAFEVWHDQWTRAKLGLTNAPSLIAQIYVEKAYKYMKEQEKIYKQCIGSVTNND